MRAFPAAPCCVDVNDRLRALVPSAECPIAEENLAKGLLDLGHAGRVGVSCTRSAPGASQVPPGPAGLRSVDWCVCVQGRQVGPEAVRTDGELRFWSAACFTCCVFTYLFPLKHSWSCHSNYLELRAFSLPPWLKNASRPFSWLEPEVHVGLTLTLTPSPLPSWVCCSKQHFSSSSSTFWSCLSQAASLCPLAWPSLLLLLATPQLPGSLPWFWLQLCNPGPAGLDLSLHTTPLSPLERTSRWGAEGGYVQGQQQPPVLGP